MNTTVNDSYNQDKIDELVRQALGNLNGHSRILIAVGGGPGSGKSTVARAVSGALIDRGISSVVVGMDGFHLTRKELLQMPDPELAFKRRGAPFTFNANGFVEFVQEIRQSCDVEVEMRLNIYGPSFDHKVKDPEPNGISISPGIQVVIIEGLYTLIDEKPWDKVQHLVDLKWFVEVDPEEATTRVAHRHVAAGIESTLDLALARVAANDLLNLQYVVQHKVSNIDAVL